MKTELKTMEEKMKLDPKEVMENGCKPRRTSH